MFSNLNTLQCNSNSLPPFPQLFPSPIWHPTTHTHKSTWWRVPPSLPHQKMRTNMTNTNQHNREDCPLPAVSKNTNQYNREGFSLSVMLINANQRNGEGCPLPAMLKNRNWHNREVLPPCCINKHQSMRCPLLVVLIHMEPMVWTYTGFGTCVTCEYRYPYLPKPIPVSMNMDSGVGAGTRWITYGLPMTGPNHCHHLQNQVCQLDFVDGGLLVLKGPVSRPVQDWKKTGPRPVFQKTAVLVFQIFKWKTAERPVYMDRLRPVFCAPQLPLQM